MQANPSCSVSCHFPYISIILQDYNISLFIFIESDLILQHFDFCFDYTTMELILIKLWLIIRHRAQLCCVRKKKKGRRKHLLAVKVEWLWKEESGSSQGRTVRRGEFTNPKIHRDEIWSSHLHWRQEVTNLYLYTVMLTRHDSTSQSSVTEEEMWHIVPDSFSLASTDYRLKPYSGPGGTNQRLAVLLSWLQSAASPQHVIQDSVMLSARQLQSEILNTGSGLVLATDSSSC